MKTLIWWRQEKNKSKRPACTPQVRDVGAKVIINCINVVFFILAILLHFLSKNSPPTYTSYLFQFNESGNFETIQIAQVSLGFTVILYVIVSLGLGVVSHLYDTHAITAVGHLVFWSVLRYGMLGVLLVVFSGMNHIGEAALVIAVNMFVMGQLSYFNNVYRPNIMIKATLTTAQYQAFSWVVLLWVFTIIHLVLSPSSICTYISPLPTLVLFTGMCYLESREIVYEKGDMSAWRDKSLRQRTWIAILDTLFTLISLLFVAFSFYGIC